MEELTKHLKDKNKLLVVAGIIHSSKAFVGPEVLHIDLTNACNFNCIACWCRSPLLQDKAMPDWERKLTLSLGIIKGVFNDLSRMGGLRQVKLVGGGEPFLHPNILEIVEYIKNKDKNIEIDINTNFSLVDEKVAVRLIELGVDSLTISLWAGTAQAYISTHPNQSEKTFYKIRDVLKIISEKKKQLGLAKPKIIIHDVIFNLNYKDVLEMLNFALEIGASDIQFVPIDPVKGKTESLLLNDAQRRELLNTLYIIRQRYDSNSFQYTSEDGSLITLSDFDGFILRTEKLDISTGVYDEERVERVPCYVGWLFARVMATGNVVPCCKGHRMVMGNVYKDSFKKIWNSGRYKEFRYKGKYFDKSNPYFTLIGNDAS